MPKTRLFEMAAQNGLVEERYWEEYVLGKRDDGLPYLFPGADRWVGRAYRSFYFRLAYIFFQLKRVRDLRELIKKALGAAALLVMRFRR